MGIAQTSYGHLTAGGSHPALSTFLSGPRESVVNQNMNLCRSAFPLYLHNNPIDFEDINVILHFTFEKYEDCA